jgi:hypothetical protein
VSFDFNAYYQTPQKLCQMNFSSGTFSPADVFTKRGTIFKLVTIPNPQVKVYAAANNG